MIIQCNTVQHSTVCFLSEANLFKDKPDYMCQVEGYKLTMTKTMTTLGYSWLILLTREGLHYTLEEGRMEEGISTIWIRVGGKEGRGS